MLFLIQPYYEKISMTMKNLLVEPQTELKKFSLYFIENFILKWQNKYSYKNNCVKFSQALIPDGILNAGYVWTPSLNLFDAYVCECLVVKLNRKKYFWFRLFTMHFVHNQHIILCRMLISNALNQYQNHTIFLNLTLLYNQFIWKCHNSRDLGNWYYSTIFTWTSSFWYKIAFERFWIQCFMIEAPLLAIFIIVI